MACVAAAEAVGKVHIPFGSLRQPLCLRLVRQQVEVLLGVGNFPVVKAGLHLFDVPVGVLHGGQLQTVPQGVQGGPLFWGGGIGFQKPVKFPLVPHPGLLRRIQPTGQKEAQEVFKTTGQGVDMVPRQVGRIDGKHHFPKAIHKATVDAVSSCPADDFRPYRGAKVAAVGVPWFQTKLGKVNVQFLVFLKQCHGKFLLWPIADIIAPLILGYNAISLNILQTVKIKSSKFCPVRIIRDKSVCDWGFKEFQYSD